MDLIISTRNTTRQPAMLQTSDLVNKQVIFKQDPGEALVTTDNMEVVSSPFKIPAESELEPGTLVARNLYVSLDPYMRGRMRTKAKSYIEPFEIGKIMHAGVIAQVVAGSRPGIHVGDTILGFLGIENYTVIPTSVDVGKVEASPNMPISYYLGVAGAPGATAYYGLVDLCKPKAGETLFVSGAAGAVGLIVGQIGKILGLRVIGSAGTDDKVQLLKTKYGFDEAFNYKTEPLLTKALIKAAPKGIDIYFDNVGADHLDAAFAVMNTHGRIAACGMISQYNGQAYQFKNMMSIVAKQLVIRGFIISEHYADPVFMKRFLSDVTAWVAQGKMSYQEHVVEGIERVPEAFVGLFKGVNTGKLLAKL